MDDFETVLPKLAGIPLFADFDIKKEDDLKILKNVYEIINIKKFKKGEVIIKEGEYGDLCYILYSGSVRITRKTPAGDIIALANLDSSQNVFFGENALITNDPRSATVTASSECSTIALSGKKFLALCEKQTVLGFRVILYLAKGMLKTIRETNNDKATLYEALFNEIEGNYE